MDEDRIAKLIEQATERAVKKMLQGMDVRQEYLSLKDAAVYCGLSKNHLRSQIQMGLLPASDIGTPAKPNYRLSRTNLDKFMKDRETGPVRLPTSSLRPDKIIPVSKHFG